MIRLEHITKSFGSRTIIEDLSLHFSEGERIALFGANGAGKTTLLNILCGLDHPDSGDIITPKNFRIGFLPQEVSQTPEPTVLEECVFGGEGYIQTLAKRHKEALHVMSEDYSEKNHAIYENVDREFRHLDGYSLEANASFFLKGLGFNDERLATPTKELSGGWRMRVELVKILLNKPNFLILDEPTNHLDLPSLVWVEKWLMNFEGTLLFVSHDRSLLERLPTMVLHLENAKVTQYKGNLSQFLIQKEQIEEQRAAQAATFAKKRAALEHFVQRFGAKATKAAQAQSKLKMIARLKAVESSLQDDSVFETMGFSLEEKRKSGRIVLKMKDLSIGYDHALSKNITVDIERGHKVAVIGANGIGKSTLLKTVVQIIPSLAGGFEFGYQADAAYFSQDQVDTLDVNKTVLENVREAAMSHGDGAIRSILGNLLFHGEDVFKKVKVLSGGEKARVGLACVLVKEANFLLLDEPTNHLDLSSCEILAQALSEFTGTVLFVSHDRNFIDTVCTHVFAMLPDGRHALFPGKLEDYERLAALAGFPNVLKADIGDNKNSERETPRKVENKAKDKQKLERKFAKLGDQVAELKLNIEKLDKELEETHSNFSKAQEISEQREKIQEQIRDLEDQMENLLTEMES